MKRNRKKRNRLSVSLFPFLAVLICTLGVLIVMLVMAAKSADLNAETAQSEDDQQNLERIDEIQQALDLRLFQIEGMEAARPDTVARLESSRTNRSHIEDDIRELKREFELVGAELLALRQDPEQDGLALSEFSESEADAELTQLAAKIESARDNLDRKRKTALETGTKAFMIVPYRGNGGTFRRPIFIECTKDAIILQPSGIELAKKEFTPPLEPGNMLDSALLAVREYWRRYDLAGKEGNAYPLIVVRPDGSETFVLARHAMKSWDDEFGYELVESEKKLDFGTVDPQLDAEIKDAIAEARKRQRYRRAQIANLKRAAQNRRARHETAGSGPGLTASGPFGGFVSSESGRPDRHRESQDRTNQGRGSFVSHTNQRDRIGETGMSEKPARQARAGHAAAEQGGPSSNNAASGGQSAETNVGNPYDDLSVAKKRGKNWALPTRTSGGTPYLRPIRIICGADFLELKTADAGVTRIPIPQNTVDAIDSLVEEIWKKIDSWGISGASSYWKPQLRFSILPGGEDRFEQLKGLLHQSGIVVTEAKQ